MRKKLLSSCLMEAFLRGGVFLAGMTSALIAAPFLYGAENPPEQSQRVHFDVQGMNNNLDADKIQRGLKGMRGVISTQCDHVRGKCHIRIDPSKVNKEDVAVQVNKMGYQAFLSASSPY